MHGPWWLIFPVMGMGFGFFGMWLGHKRRAAELSLLQTYISQGKEPPTELVEACLRRAKPGSDHRNSAIFNGALGVAFGLVYLLMRNLDLRTAMAFLIAGIIFGCVAIGLLITTRVSSSSEKK